MRGEKGVKNWIKFADGNVLKNWEGCVKNLLWMVPKVLVLNTKNIFNACHKAKRQIDGHAG